MQNAKIANILCYSCEVKQFHRTNGVRLLTVIVSAKRCECRPSSAFVAW